MIVLGIHCKDALHSVASCGENLPHSDRMHTPELDVLAACKSSCETIDSQQKLVVECIRLANQPADQPTDCRRLLPIADGDNSSVTSNSVGSCTNQLLQIPGASQADGVGQGLHVLQSAVITRDERMLASQLNSPVFSKQNFPSLYSLDNTVKECCIQLFEDHKSDITGVVSQQIQQPVEIEKLVDVPGKLQLQSSAVHENDGISIPSGVVLASTGTKETMTKTSSWCVASLPKVVPVVYVNSNGKPTGFELVQPVPSPSYFNKPAAVADARGWYHSISWIYDLVRRFLCCLEN